MAQDFILTFILAMIQAVTEWVPVSSSGHLVLFSKLFGYEGGMSFNLAVHFGTLIAVVVYFWNDLMGIFKSFLRLDFKSQDGKLGLYLIVASIPAAIVGIAFKSFFEGVFSSLEGVSIGFGITGLLLLIGSLNYKIKLNEKEKGVGFKRAFVVGCFQILSIFPGVSRSGSTLSSGILFGLSEEKAMRFAFLMAVPIIFGASIISLEFRAFSLETLWAILVSFVFGLLTIHFLLNYVLLDKRNLKWFAAYAFALALGTGIYVLFY